MPYSYVNPDGARSIDAAATFVSALGSRNPLGIQDFSTVLTECERLVRTEFQPSQGALNNVRGTWYEWLISIGAIHFANSVVGDTRILVPLPNVRSLDYSTLYDESVHGFIQDLKDKTTNHDVTLVSSNPDFVIVERDDGWNLPDVALIDSATLQQIDNFYQQLVGQLSFEMLVGFASIKTSLRPDRRLQLSHEGALVKALYEHLKTRLWEYGSNGVKYYGVSQAVSRADRDGLKTVATHSILSVNSVPEKAVDAVFAISGGAELSDFFQRVLVD